ncbi:MAG: hypothetical protein ABL999_17420 [Pyrinomonadaceae bacterium]
MATSELELRVQILEKELAKLKDKLVKEGKIELPWWEKISGAFADSEDFEEAMRIGREYRKNLKDWDEE